ncbi:hypothetical protein PspLS_07124 [Pyricularia sp. CBS 133598]|nr:hypothetical protein PspLS_07124 [Pyricularia sp. CBS 133598]
MQLSKFLQVTASMAICWLVWAHSADVGKESGLAARNVDGQNTAAERTLTVQFAPLPAQMHTLPGANVLRRAPVIGANMGYWWLQSKVA